MTGPRRTGALTILAGDIGGTKSLIAMFEFGSAGLRIVREERFESAVFPGLGPMIQAFRAATPNLAVAACFGIAGPIVAQRSQAVNLPWQVDGKALAEEIGIPRTRIVNDFHAVGHGLPHLEAADLVVLQEGAAVPRGPIALIGAGTGLGEGYLTWSGGRYQVHPSEGGHTDFAPHTPLETGLLGYLQDRLGGHVSWERVLSGPGLRSIYAFLVETGVATESEEVRAAMSAEDPAAVITRFALSRADPACDRALDLFVSSYGSEAGNLALKLLSLGGVYVAGGIAPRILERLREGAFIRAFLEKGRHAALLETIPVRVVTNPRVGLIGAAAIAARMADEASPEE